MRVRDEIKMTIHAYQTLYESSIAYGMRKALMAEQGKNEVQTDISNLGEQCKSYDEEIKELQEQIEKMIREDAEETEKEEKKHTDEVVFLNDLNADYKEELETLLSTPAKWVNAVKTATR